MNDEAMLTLLAFACLLVAVGSANAVALSLHGGSSYLWEPQWKREARELSRYVPTGDEWGR